MDTHSEEFKKELSKVFLEVTHKLDYPEETFSFKYNYSKNDENSSKLVSTQISINEFSYPFDEQNKIAKSSSVILIKPDKHNWMLLVLKHRFRKIDLPPSAKVVNNPKASDQYYHVCFAFDDLAFYKYIKNTLIYCINHYDSSNSFGCCSKFKECSSTMKCLHTNKLYAKGCKYRFSLENGRNFLLER